MRVRVAFVSVAILIQQLGSAAPVAATQDALCGDAQLIYARGTTNSVNDQNFQLLDSELRGRLGPSVTYSSYQLGLDGGYGGFSYPAAGDRIEFILQLSPLRSKVYSDSKEQGRAELVAYLNHRVTECADEYYVVAGYSQGADVIDSAMKDLDASVRARIAFIALFGDPRFQSGNTQSGFFSDQCDLPRQPWVRGTAPCYSRGWYAESGPYLPDDVLLTKTGSWCRDKDVACDGNPLDVNSDEHENYFVPGPDGAMAMQEAAQHLATAMPDQANDIDTTMLEFATGANGADLAFVIDTTGSMGGQIADVESQATALAQQWLSKSPNARIALVEYRDQGSSFVARVDLGLTSDANAFQTAVNALSANEGGDTPEAELSGIMTALDQLNWQTGATKAAVVITDAPGKDPEPVTGYTRTSVAQHALQIDPVAIYGVDVLDDPTVNGFMQPLASGTAGEVVVLHPGDSLTALLSDLLNAVALNPVALLHGPYYAATGNPVHFSAAGSFDPDGSIASYKWDFDANGTVDQTTTQPAVDHTYPFTYSGMASVRVVAADGGEALASTTVSVTAAGLRGLAPLTPQSASAAITGANQVTVSWTPAASDRASSYIVQLNGSVVFRSVASGAGNSVVIDGIDLTAAQVFTVRASNAYGSTPAVTSNSVGGPSTWSPSTRVNAADGLLQIVPAAAISTDGTVHAVWVNGWTSPNVELYYAKRNPASGAWSTPQIVNNVTTGDQFEPDIASDGAGNVFAIWTDARASADRNIYFAKRSASTGTWSASVRVNDDPTNKQPDQRYPAIAVSSTGEAIAVWYDGRSSKDNVYAARLPAGSSTWSTNMKVTAVSSLKKGTDVAIGPDGTAHAVWYEPASGDANIWYSSLPLGSSVWSAPVKVSDDLGTSFQGDPQVAVDGSGRVIVAWQDWRTNPFQLRARVKPSGGSWQPSVVITSDGANGPSLAARSSGMAFVTWNDGVNSLTSVLKGSWYNPTTGIWSAPEQISDTVTGDSNTASAVVMSASNTFVVYQNQHSVAGGGTDTDIYSKVRTGP